MTMHDEVTYTIPGMDDSQATRLVDILEDRLVALSDMTLTLKHIHWNVVGPNFIAVHEMLDPQYESVSEMVDEVAERIATLGGTPRALPGAIVQRRAWDDYSIGRDTAQAHLGALDQVYSGLIASHRAAMKEAEELDLVTQDLLTQQAGKLEQYHWFVRAHLENADGRLSTAGATSEQEAADRARSST
jgi:starvation-inducible DNA-binding protein